MSRKRSNFMIGLFVMAGVVIGVLAIVWLGASEYFEKGFFYVTYFDESVQGLQVDSRVKYRGVEIGKVQSIAVAPDRNLVEVIMKIDLHGETGENVVTQLRAVGITGIVFIELDRKIEGNPILMPPSDMKTRYPVIASQTSQSKQILRSVDQIIGKIDAMDLRGISDQIKQTLRVTESFISGRQLSGTMSKISSTAGSIDEGLRKIDRILAQGRVEDVLDETRQTLQETRQALQEARKGLQESRETVAAARRFVAVLQDEIKDMKAVQKAEQAGRLIEGMDRRSREITADVRRTTDEIRQAVDSLKILLDRLHANPSDLLFSRPPADEDPRMDEVLR